MIEVGCPCSCGVQRDLSAYNKLIEEGIDEKQAWEQSKEEVEASEQSGTWGDDGFVWPADINGEDTGYCHPIEIA